MNEVLTKDTLQTLKNRLPKGYAEKVKIYLPRNKKHVTSQYLSQVLNGATEDLPVLESLITLAEKHEEYVKMLATRAKGLTTAEGDE